MCFESESVEKDRDDTDRFLDDWKDLGRAQAHFRSKARLRLAGASHQWRKGQDWGLAVKGREH